MAYRNEPVSPNLCVTMTRSTGTTHWTRRLSLLCLGCVAFGLQTVRSEQLGPAYYTVQVMALSESNRANALALRDGLRAKGFQAYVVLPRGADGKGIYKVRIGRFAGREEALRLAERLKREEGFRPLVLKSWLVPAQDPSPGKPESPSAAFTPTPSSTPQKAAAEVEPLDVEPPSISERSEQPSSEAGGRAWVPWPRSATRIYVYRDPQGALHVTNLIDRIPPEQRPLIEKITVYPALYLSPGRRPGRLLLQMAGKTQEVVLAGIVPSKTASDAGFKAFFEANLAGRALRVEYDPRRTTAEGLIYGWVTYRNGTSVNHEVVRCGLGEKKGGAPY